MPSLVTFALSIAGITLLFKALFDRATVLGAFRDGSVVFHNAGYGDLKYIEGINCEDLHYDASSGLIFTSCQTTDQSRAKWFPPLGNMDDPSAGGDGELRVIDPKVSARARRRSNKRKRFSAHDFLAIRMRSKLTRRHSPRANSTLRASTLTSRPTVSTSLRTPSALMPSTFTPSTTRRLPSTPPARTRRSPPTRRSARASRSSTTSLALTRPRTSGPSSTTSSVLPTTSSRLALPRSTSPTTTATVTAPCACSRALARV